MSWRRSHGGPQSMLLAIVLLAGCGLVLAMHAGGEVQHDVTAVPTSDGQATWQQRCASCHVAFRPDLLPASSWRELIDELPDHFGVAVELPAAQAVAVLAFLESQAANRVSTAIALGVMERMASTDRPLRVTETRWFRSRHFGIARATWARSEVASPANCAACHRNAERGIFDELSVHIPG